MTDMGGPRMTAERQAESTRTVPVFLPTADIYETNDALVLTLEMPGIGPDGVNISLDKRLLTISGRGTPKTPENQALAQTEYRVGDYERSFALSQEIDSAGIEATMKDGVVRLVLPKAKPAPAKTIEIRAN
jgi:HSP20 family molecular chaperone IbpA